MAPFYRLILFIFACTAYWGGTSCFSSSATAAIENKTQQLTDTSRRVSTLPLADSARSWQIAQNSPEKPPKKDPKTPPKPKTPFRFPSRLLLLGVGALIVTGGAILILIRLLSHPDDGEGTVVDIEAETVTESHPEPPQSSPPPPLAEIRAITQGQTQAAPTVIQQNQPSVSLEENGYRDTTLKVSPTDTPSETPTASENPPAVNNSVTDTVNIHPPSYQSKLDPQEKWINDLKQINPDIRSNAIWELAQAGDSRAIQPLLELLIDSDSNQRSLVLAALSEIGNRTLKPLNRALSLSLQDENAEVRKNAIRDLSRIYDLATQMSQILQRAVDDPDPEVQEMAKWATNRLSRLRSVSSRDQPPIG
ncbi:conserved exported hypothetical protein [Planktothrix serta PCC 8927]|uniref:HEAT repeat domain-containing protein n=1 Tax=Planktothrix serta PCC 8927 TaxID=671068 RepID=A0A7Z9BWJ4_9CYAN|nr:HEAT repeat domain-containing protein [Planktothrix serta]VXD23938.1 conserved exported hypothetical protein [Planktothrix serta PCC 8927]